MSDDGERVPRSAAEWTTFAASCVVLLVVVVLIAVQMREPRTPAAPVAAVVGEPTERGGVYTVEVDLENRGDETAANVQVTADLTIGGDTASGDQTVDFLAGGEEERLAFVFHDDPADGDLSVAVTSYAEP
jgi:uncharacterized protein (TIGR02588 family)